MTSNFNCAGADQKYNLCKNPLYETLVRYHCPLYCNKCQTQTTSSVNTASITNPTTTYLLTLTGSPQQPLTSGGQGGTGCINGNGNICTGGTGGGQVRPGKDCIGGTGNICTGSIGSTENSGSSSTTMDTDSSGSGSTVSMPLNSSVTNGINTFKILIY